MINFIHATVKYSLDCESWNFNDLVHVIELKSVEQQYIIVSGIPNGRVDSKRGINVSTLLQYCDTNRWSIELSPFTASPKMGVDLITFDALIFFDAKNNLNTFVSNFKGHSICMDEYKDVIPRSSSILYNRPANAIDMQNLNVDLKEEFEKHLPSYMVPRL